MDRKRKVGVKGEKIALDYLLDKGMHIEALNWRAGHKEIDIIAKENEMVVFIAVRDPAGSGLKRRRAVSQSATAARHTAI